MLRTFFNDFSRIFGQDFDGKVNSMVSRQTIHPSKKLQNFNLAPSLVSSLKSWILKRERYEDDGRGRRWGGEKETIKLLSNYLICIYKFRQQKNCRNGFWNYNFFFLAKSYLKKNWIEFEVYI